MLWKHPYLIWTLYCRHWWRWLRWRRIYLHTTHTLVGLPVTLCAGELPSPGELLIAWRTPWKHPYLIWTLYCRHWLRWLRWRRISWCVDLTRPVSSPTVRRTPWKHLSLIWTLYCRLWWKCMRWWGRVWPLCNLGLACSTALKGSVIIARRTVSNHRHLTWDRCFQQVQDSLLRWAIFMVVFMQLSKRNTQLPEDVVASYPSFARDESSVQLSRCVSPLLVTPFQQ